MCTLSIIALCDGPGGYRLVCSRDEQRDRSPALPPAWHDVRPGLRAAWPTDTLAGGTWLAARSDGLALCLLNLNEEGLRPAPPRAISRGMVIPSILAAVDEAALAGAVSRLDLDAMAPFRLVITRVQGAGEVACRVLRWDRSALTESSAVGSALCFVSSGLGDRCVAPRLELFGRVVSTSSPLAGEQDSFHEHSWPERPEISVCMSRADARTVSVTTVECRPGPAVSVAYRAVPELSAARAIA